MGEGDQYEEHAPTEALRPFIRTLWTYCAPAPSGDVQRIAPDGCPELVVDIGAPYEEQGPDGVFRIQPRALFAGQMTRPLALRAAGPVELIAIRFEPDGARDWLDLPLIKATDRRLDMAERMKDVRPPSGNVPGQVALILAWLEEQRCRNHWQLDPVVRAEVQACTLDPAPESRSSAERRALQRRFRDRVGIAPRTLRAIHRFRRVFDHVAEAESDAGTWLQAGLDAGYFDQPQMARDFRRFLGCTATEWASDQVELARRIASQSYKPSLHSPL